MSLDSPVPEEHDRFRGLRGAFAAAVAGIGHFVAAGLRPQIIMSVYRGNLDRIEGLIELAIRLDPRLAVAHERLAECRRRQGRLDEALEGFTRALALDGRSADAYCGRGSTEMTLFLKDSKRGDMRDRAIEDWHRSLELEPDQPRLRTLVARYTPRGTRNEELVGPISTPD